MPRTETLNPHPRIEALPHRLDAAPWMVHGVVSGVTGAFLVAILFLVVDLVRGQPLWTPHALGSALFLGEAPAVHTSPALVAGYTVVHGAVFVSLGFLAATLLPLLRLERESARRIVGLVGLFVAFELAFGLFGVLVASGAEALQPGPVALANLLAAAAMSTYLAAATGSLRERDE